MLPSTALLTALVAVAALPRSPSVRPRAPSPCMKGVAGFKFSLDMWYGGNDFAGGGLRDTGCQLRSQRGDGRHFRQVCDAEDPVG